MRLCIAARNAAYCVRECSNLILGIPICETPGSGLHSCNIIVGFYPAPKRPLDGSRMVFSGEGETSFFEAFCNFDVAERRLVLDKNVYACLRKPYSEKWLCWWWRRQFLMLVRLTFNK